MILNLPNVGVIPNGIDTSLGVIPEVKPKSGSTLIDLARVKDYTSYRQTLKGERGDVGLTGVEGLTGLTGDSAYLIERDNLEVTSLQDYLNLFDKSYYLTLLGKHIKCFTSYWNTKNTDYNSSLPNQIELPLVSTGEYDAFVFWGDGTSERIIESKPLLHTYPEDGIYKVIISGVVKGFSFRDGRDQHKILLISNWGGLTLTENIGAFRNCSQLNIIAQDLPKFNNVYNFQEYFANCINLKTVPNIQLWPWADITNANSMFINCLNLVEDLSFLFSLDFDLNNLGV